MNRLITIGGALILGVVVAAAAYRLVVPAGPKLPPPPRSSDGASEDKPADSRGSIAALGRLTPRGGVVDLGAIAGNRVSQLLVSEGQDVKAGAPLAYLQDYGLRQSELKYAEQQLAEAQAKLKVETAYADTMLDEAKIGVKQAALQDREIEAQSAKLQLLDTNLQVAKSDWNRIEGLDSKVISPQEREHQELLVTQAKQELSSGQAALEKLRAGQALNVENADAQLRAAKINLERVPTAVPIQSFEENVHLAGQKLEQAIVRAPIDGRILKIVTHPGEMIGQAPILQMGDVNQMEVVAEVYETDIGLVKVGQRATINSRALPESLSGVVERIGSMVAQNEVMSLDPAARADARVVQVEIRLEDSQAAARLVNLQVDVTIHVRDEATQESVASAP